MDMKTDTESKSFSQRLKEYLPLILIIGTILVLIAGWEIYQGRFLWRESMRLFMGLFFLFFGFFKTLDLKGFVMAFGEYDVLAKRSKFYAYLYPFIELSLGALFILDLYPFWVNLATVVVMSVGSIGVIQVVANKQKIRCACLGTVVKLPMTTVTIIEDVGMGVMALVMLLTAV